MRPHDLQDTSTVHYMVKKQNSQIVSINFSGDATDIDAPCLCS